MENKSTFDSPFAVAFEGVTAPETGAEVKSDVSDATAKPINYEEGLTEEELEAVKKYSERIDIKDSTTILTYGAASQKRIADFSETTLAGVKNKDLGETGDMLADLITELRGLRDEEEEEKKGFLGLFRRTKNKLEGLKARYSKAEESVDSIVAMLEQHQLTLMKDIAVFDNLYEMNLAYIKEITMYIAAGRRRLDHEISVTLPAIVEYAKNSGKPEDAQAAKDYADMCARFERRLHDLELSRMVAVQTAPQIRLLQNNDSMMSEKLQTVIVNTVPLWKSQMVLALGLAHSEEALKAQRSVTDMTNELLKKNASRLRTATVGVAKEAERGIVDIETLTATNEELIATLEEVDRIRTEASAKRAAAQAELGKMETALRQKLLEINSVGGEDTPAK